MHYLKFLKLARKSPTSIGDADAAAVHAATSKALNSALGAAMRRLNVFGDGINVFAVLVAGFLLTSCFGLMAHLLEYETGGMWARLFFANFVVLSIYAIHYTKMRRAHELAGLISEREDESCARALLVCEESPGATDYRKSILVRGEPIRYFHYLHMGSIAEAERAAAKRAEEDRQEAVWLEYRKTSCQKLHEVA